MSKIILGVLSFVAMEATANISNLFDNVRVNMTAQGFEKNNIVQGEGDATVADDCVNFFIKKDISMQRDLNAEELNSILLCVSNSAPLPSAEKYILPANTLGRLIIREYERQSLLGGQLSSDGLFELAADYALYLRTNHNVYTLAAADLEMRLYDILSSTENDNLALKQELVGFRRPFLSVVSDFEVFRAYMNSDDVEYILSRINQINEIENIDEHIFLDFINELETRMSEVKQLQIARVECAGKWMRDYQMVMQRRE